MLRRGQKNLLAKLALSAYGYTYNHDLDWGKGGPEQWPQNKPYITPLDSQDQKGFRNFEWVDAIARSILERSLPIFLLGLSQKTAKISDVYSETDQVEVVNEILHVLRSASQDQPEQNILAGNFWLLSASGNDAAASQAWVKEDGSTLAVVNLLAPDTYNSATNAEASAGKRYARSAKITGQPIGHYLLLPVYEWGIADWHLEVIKPFILKYHPTIGFSLEEAALAKKVTVIGGEQTFSEEKLNELRAKGCEVDRISGDGTTIATLLAER